MRALRLFSFIAYLNFVTNYRFYIKKIINIWQIEKYITKFYKLETFGKIKNFANLSNFNLVSK